MAPENRNPSITLPELKDNEPTTSGGPPAILLSAAQGQEAPPAFEGIEWRQERQPTELTEISGLGRLKKALPISIVPEGGGYLVRSPELDIATAGATILEALDAFYAFFREDAEHWRAADERKLTSEARALKSRYLEYVG